jgi:multidrug efflux system membrane fusion protein
MRARFICVLLGCPIVALSAIALGDDKSEPKAVEIQVAKPVTQEITDYVDFTGRTEAIESVDLRSRLSGQVVKVNFKGGTAVKKGDLLFELDSRVYQAEVDKSSAELQRAEARVQRSVADLDHAKKLAENKAISKEELDRAVADLQEAQAGQTAARAARDRTKLELEYTRITAPISGNIGRPLVTVGNYANAGTTTMATIVSTDPMAVNFSIDERTFFELQKQAREGTIKDLRDWPYTVWLRLGNADAYNHAGKIDFVDNHANPSNGTILVRAVFPNPAGTLIPGLFAPVRLETSKPHKALMVNGAVVMTKDGKPFVFVVNAKNTIESRSVILGQRQGDLREVKSGLNADDLVVLFGRRFHEGDSVTPKAVAMPGVPENTEKPTPNEK